MFLIDWLTFTSKVDSTSSIIEFLKLTKIEFTITNGFYGYRDSLYFNGIRIHYNPRSEDMGICIEMSGTGCRTYEEYGSNDFNSIFDLILKNKDDYNITRIDIAFDDKIGIIPIKKLGDDTQKGNFISKWEEWTVINSSKGYTVEVGSQTSECFLRIYDKASERGFSKEECPHWVRLELQLRKQRAFEFIKKLQYTSIGELWTGILYNYLRYVIPSKTDLNKSRWKLTKYWEKLIDNAEKIKIFTSVGEDYNMANLHNYIIKQAGGALKTYIQINGVNKLVNELEENKSKLNPKYQRLISESKLQADFDFLDNNLN